MNIRDFSNNYQSQKSSEKEKSGNNQNYENILNNNPQQTENLQDTLNKYKDLSSQDLMSELMREASRLKQNGSLNDNSLNMLKNTLAPMLTKEQNQQLDSIINMIK